MIDGGQFLTAYGNNYVDPTTFNNGNFGTQSGNFGTQNGNFGTQDVFPYSIDMTNLANYNQYTQYANAAAQKRSDDGSLTGGKNQGSNTQNRAVTSLTSSSNNNNVVNNAKYRGGSSLTGYNQPTTTASPYTGMVTTTPVYNQLYNGVSAYNYGSAKSNAGSYNNYNYGSQQGTGVGTGSGATSATTISSINPYIYKISKRQSFEQPMDLMTADNTGKLQLTPSPFPAKKVNQKLDKVLKL